MLHTTFALARKSKACAESYKKMRAALGDEWGLDAPIPLTKVLEILGLDDALWTLRCTIEPSERESRLLACTFAEHVLPFFENLHPEDKRPRRCIEIATLVANGLATLAARTAARAAARTASDAVTLVANGLATLAARTAARAAASAASSAPAWFAAWEVAWDASIASSAPAWDAPWAAEREWQQAKFLEMLGGK